MIGNILSILDWVKDKLPIQDRKERWKNEYDSLTKERAEILLTKADVKKANRLEYLNNRLDVLERLFRNQTAKG